MRFNIGVSCIAALAFTALLNLSAPAGAEVSSNIPLESRVYGDLEYLEVRGFIKSGMFSTRPFTWMEGARLSSEAERRWNALGDREKARAARAGAMIKRLGRRFERELSAGLENSGGWKGGGVFSLKPGRTYADYIYSDGAPLFADRNNSGDEFRKGSNLRAGFDAELRLADAASFYFNPEYRSSEGLSEVEFKRGYVMT
ncbi:MAG: hypothetical protein Q8P48_06580, partial [Deltaproteobacteria bacterium]|nr:hypothetical protein [Deltaproteobacteria bacterium]